MKAKILGFIVSETKSGNVGTTLYLETEHDQYRRENARKCIGNACCSEYIRGDYSGTLEVGQEVILVYGKGYEGRAVLVNIIPADEA